MAGLLAANILRRFNPLVKDQQKTIPHNHSALLRFRTTAVSDATGIPFKEVHVEKGIWDGKTVHNACTIPLANAYSKNAVSSIERRSIWNMAPSKRYISPPGFVEQMCQGLDLHLNEPFSKIDHGRGLLEDLVISTLPMKMMMNLFDYPDREKVKFVGHDICTLTARILVPETNVHQTLYNAQFVSPAPLWYRATIQGDRLIVEGRPDVIELWGKDCLSDVQQIVDAFGISDERFMIEDVEIRPMRLGKIVPIDEHERLKFICWLTDEFQIYSLGRYATWRPLLLDDLVHDVKKIEQMATSKYHRRLNS